MLTGDLYEIETICINCGRVKMIEIPKGTVVSKYLEEKTTKCTNCDIGGSLVTKFGYDLASIDAENKPVGQNQYT